jgi:hypothetical protein
MSFVDNQDNVLPELNEQTTNNPLILKEKSKPGRPRICPINPETGKTIYKDKRLHNKVQCPNCQSQITESNITHHKKTNKCKIIGENLRFKKEINS